ncbi:NIPSNAP family protein [Mycobacterium paraterrae]|uniref:NIPSNAP family protein n=1 Tax=Mycobacterium paraterrae TaxID=577492 RepID=A0ABY3VLI0_9MYCO|nr:NIPSNAP family protein [Mycobacterium paraterrae]UMB69476.1 NIPSNAP family protein [Mycobacterium paraterrae]
MFQLRIYTLRTPEALAEYAAVHWARHVTTFPAFGVTTHGVWTQHGDQGNRLVALIAYPPGADVGDVTRRVMSSPEFAADMAGFDVADILDVQSTLLDPTQFSPIR